MLKNGKRIKRKRSFSEDFKLKLVADYESGVNSVSELSIIYDIAETIIYRWIYKYSTYNKKSIQMEPLKTSISSYGVFLILKH